MNPNYNYLKDKVSRIPKVTARPMFGYHCYSVSGKFFVGFNNKNNYQIIIRLPREQQEIAIKNKGIRPSPHGTKMGWIQINAKEIKTEDAFKWILKGHKYAKNLAKNSLKTK